MTLTRYYILEGDTTTTGGVVQKTTNPIVFNVAGKRQSCIGDDVWCPACQSMGKIAPDGARLSFSLGGAMPALHDDLCLCKCSPPPRLVHSQTTFKEIIDGNTLAQYQQTQSSLQNNLTDTKDSDDVLPNFTVHFRRPEEYQGEYGFDWVRDEYIHPLVNVNGKNQKLLASLNNANLIKEYRTFKKQAIQPLQDIDSQSYTPAWLTLFPSNSPIGVSQVDLHLRIDTEDNQQSFIADDTLLSFECSTGLQIHTTISSLGDVLSKSKQNTLTFEQKIPPDVTKPITKEALAKTETKNIIYYQSQSPVLTLTCTQSFSQLGYIKVFAQKGISKKQVGLLCVYPNNTIKKAIIQPVFVSHRQEVTHYESVYHPKDFQNGIQNSLLSQALIQAEFKAFSEVPFNLTQIAAVNQNATKDRSLAKAFLGKYQDSNIPSEQQGKFLEDVVDVYAAITGDNPYHNQDTTYLFFTDYSASNQIGSTGGIALADDETSNKCQESNECHHWKNVALVFLNTGHDDVIHTVIHELGHSFGLAHIFTDDAGMPNFENPVDFRKGYTDNIMDYTTTKFTDQNNHPIYNIYTNKMFSLFKWQWDKIHNDANLTTG